MDTLYLVQWDGEIIDTYAGGPVPLVRAMIEFYGVRGVTIMRADGTVVVRNAGSSIGFTHEPTGRRFRRGTSANKRTA